MFITDIYIYNTIKTMKYLKKFENHTEYEENRQNLILPNVSLCVAENEVHYNPIDHYNWTLVAIGSGWPKAIGKLDGTTLLLKVNNENYAFTCDDQGIILNNFPPYSIVSDSAMKRMTSAGYEVSLISPEITNLNIGEKLENWEKYIMV